MHLHGYIIGQYNQMEIVREAMNKHQRSYIIILSTHFDFVPVLSHFILYTSYHTHSFLSPQLETFFLHSFVWIDPDEYSNRWKNLRNWKIKTIISFIKWSKILCDIVGLQQQKQWNPLFFPSFIFSGEN